MVCFVKKKLIIIMAILTSVHIVTGPYIRVDIDRNWANNPVALIKFALYMVSYIVKHKLKEP